RVHESIAARAQPTGELGGLSASAVAQALIDPLDRPRCSHGRPPETALAGPIAESNSGYTAIEVVQRPCPSAVRGCLAGSLLVSLGAALPPCVTSTRSACGPGRTRAFRPECAR